MCSEAGIMILHEETIFAVKMELYAQKRLDPNVTIDCVLNEIKRNFEDAGENTPAMVKTTVPRWHGSLDAFVLFVDTMLLVASRYYNDMRGAKAIFYGMDHATKILANRLYICWVDLATTKLNWHALDVYINRILCMHHVEKHRLDEVLHGDKTTYVRMSRHELMYRVKHLNLMAVLNAIVEGKYKATGWENYTESLAKYMGELCTSYPDDETRALAKKALIKMIDNSTKTDECLSVYPVDVLDNQAVANDEEVCAAVKRWCQSDE
jgi:hypothetical protein